MSSLTQKGVIEVTPEGRVMKKNRERQRANRRLKEEMLDLKDACGVNDNQIRSVEIVLKK